MRFPEKLTIVIESRGTNQSRLSRQTGISQSAISAMTRGERRPYMDQALALARALDVPLDFLADDAADEPAAGLSDEEVELLRIARRVGVEASIRRVLAVDASPPPPPPPPIRRFARPEADPAPRRNRKPG